MIGYRRIKSPYKPITVTCLMNFAICCWSSDWTLKSFSLLLKAIHRLIVLQCIRKKSAIQRLANDWFLNFFLIKHIVEDVNDNNLLLSNESRNSINYDQWVEEQNYGRVKMEALASRLVLIIKNHFCERIHGKNVNLTEWKI